MAGAVPIDEAWNDSSRDQFSATPVSAPSVSARRTTAKVYVGDKEEDTERAERAERAERLVEHERAIGETYLPMILTELQEIRKEHTKRCSVYLVIAGILFALLFLYIDRLQTQMRKMNYTLRQHQFSDFVDSGRQLRPHLQPF